MIERTTDLQRIKNGNEFTWGYLLAIHEIGEYYIVEYHPWEVSEHRVLVGSANENETLYSGYFNGRSIGQSFESLDAALAGCIAYKHEGANHRADLYFMKMLAKETANV